MSRNLSSPHPSVVEQLRLLLANEMDAVATYTHATVQTRGLLAERLRVLAREHRALVADLLHALGPEGVGIVGEPVPTPWSELPRPDRLMGTLRGSRALLAILRRGEAQGLGLAAQMMKPRSALPVRRFIRACVLPKLRDNVSTLDTMLFQQRPRRGRQAPSHWGGHERLTAHTQ